MYQGCAGVKGQDFPHVTKRRNRCFIDCYTRIGSDTWEPSPLFVPFFFLFCLSFCLFVCLASFLSFLSLFPPSSPSFFLPGRMVAPLHVGGADIGGKSWKNLTSSTSFPLFLPPPLHHPLFSFFSVSFSFCSFFSPPGDIRYAAVEVVLMRLIVFRTGGEWSCHEWWMPGAIPGDSSTRFSFWLRFQESSMIKVIHARSDADLSATNHGPITRSRISLIELSTFQTSNYWKHLIEATIQHLCTSATTFLHLSSLYFSFFLFLLVLNMFFTSIFVSFLPSLPPSWSSTPPDPRSSRPHPPHVELVKWFLNYHLGSNQMQRFIKRHSLIVVEEWE